MSSRKIMKAFLKALFDGDGVQCETYVAYSSTSITLIEDLSVMLDFLDYPYYISEYKYDPSIITEKKNKRDYYVLNIYCKYYNKYINEIGFISERRKNVVLEYLEKYSKRPTQERNVFLREQVLEEIHEGLCLTKLEKEDKKIKYHILSALRDIKNVKKRQKSISREKLLSIIYIMEKYDLVSDKCLRELKFSSECEFLKINRIDKIGEDLVYDLQVEDKNHMFWANGILNHNCIIMDEFAHYVDASKKSSAKAVYNALTPSASNLYQFGEGRNIVISSPAEAEGFFYEHFQASKDNDQTFSMSLPTWNVNPNYTFELLKPEFDSDEENALQEYGAQFRPKSSSQYFPANLVSEASSRRKNWLKQDRGRGPVEYYMHIDPAKNTDRFAVLIAHSENRFSQETRTSLQYIVEDYSIAFQAPVGGYLDPDDIIDNHVLPLFKKFKIVHVSSDAFFSLEQQKKFKNRGIRFKEIAYNGIMKNKIYENLKEYLINGRLELCNDDTELAGELNGIVIDAEKSPPKFSVSSENKDFPNDDLVDCLGGVVYSLLQGSSGLTRLPRTIAANINWNRK
jgi:hypothetical protein